MPPEANSILRQATVDDVPAMIALERGSAFASHWSETAYRKVFEPDAPVRIALVFEHETAEDETAGGQAQGFLLARFTGDECELENIVVADEYKRRGAGTQLMRALIAAARERRALQILLEVRESNTAARCLYDALGFQIAGRRQSYYCNPTEDAFLYVLALDQAQA